MTEHTEEIDYGTGQKKLNIYVAGLIACVILTLLSFWVVMAEPLAKMQTVAVIFISAIIQFIVQLVCFIRLNTQTEQSRMNVISLIFTIVILTSIVAGSLWIMFDLNYFMMN